MSQTIEEENRAPAVNARNAIQDESAQEQSRSGRPMFGDKFPVPDRNEADITTLITAAEVGRIHREGFYGALRNNDLEKLSQIYSDDYMLVRPDGSAFSKAQILADLKDHSMNFKSIGCGYFRTTANLRKMSYLA